MNQRDSYILKIQAKLDEWDAQIDLMKAKAKGAEADARINYHKQIDDLEARKVDFGIKVDKLRSSAEDAWEEMKEGIDGAWAALEESFKAASAKFN